HERRIVELPRHERVDATGVEPEVEGAAELGVIGRQEQRRPVERLWKALLQARRGARGREEADARLAEQVVVSLQLDGGADRRVAEDDVRPPRREVGEE